MFNPQQYLNRLDKIKGYLETKLPANFHPQVALTLGSGGTSDFTKELEVVARIPYSEMPEFFTATVPGHKGELVAGKIGATHLLVFSGRKHLYELGFAPDLFTNLKEITLPVYLAAKMGVKLYMATNAAGGLNPQFQVGDIMLISSHFDLFFPNPLFGPELPWEGAWRFQPQTNEYNHVYRNQLLEIAKTEAFSNFVHQGTYAAVGGPTYESVIDCLAFRKLGIDAVGMSTVPEVIVATNVGMETQGFSLIANTINEKGENATSHEEVQSALNEPKVKQRFFTLLKKFLENYGA